VTDVEQCLVDRYPTATGLVYLLNLDMHLNIVGVAVLDLNFTLQCSHVTKSTLYTSCTDSIDARNGWRIAATLLWVYLATNATENKAAMQAKAIELIFHFYGQYS